jgi:DNA-binding winged helix-turn-helix (wHTH) protein/tetratricopeptide (TPR) repeat protein
MNGSKSDRYLYEFDGFRADPVRRRLSRGGDVVALTPKAFTILIALLEKRGQVVDKEDLLQQVWPDTFVTEANLTQNISSLRKALGERANDPRYVITVPGQGYSFVADVLEIPREGTGEISLAALANLLSPHPTTQAAPLPAVPPEAPAALAPPLPMLESLEGPLPPAEPERPRAEWTLPLVAPGVGPVISPVVAAPAETEVAAEPPEASAIPPLPADQSLLEDTISILPPIPPVPAPVPPSWWRTRTTFLVLLLLLVLGASLLSYREQLRDLFGGRSRSTTAAGEGPPRPDRAAVAILGFNNMSGNPEQAWLTTALTEMLTTELSTGGRVRLISGENITRARAALSLPEAAHLRSEALDRLHANLGADLIVLGSYLSLGERAGGKIRLDLQVMRVPSGETVATLSERGTESDLFDLVSRTGMGLRRALGWAAPSLAQTREAQALRPANPEAARLYSEGLTHLRAFDSRGARDLLAHAAESDPKSAVIHSALAQAWADLGYDGRATGEAEKAVQLAGSLSKQEQLAIEARFHESKRDWGKAAEIYRSLWTFFPDDLEYGLRLANALSEAGSGPEAMDAVAALRKLPSPERDDPRIDLAEARVARRVWDPDRTRRAAEAAAVKGWKMGESESQVVAQALALQGYSSQITGQLDAAINLFRHASVLFAKSGNQSQVATMLTATGVALDDQGQLVQARKQFEEALGIAQQLGNDHMVATQLANLGLLSAEEGDLAEARSQLEKANRLYTQTEDRVLEVRSSYFLGQVLWQQGDIEGARQRFERVVTASRETGSRIDEAVALEGLGQILARQGQLLDARRSHQQALALAEKLHDPYRTAGMQASLAEVSSRIGDLEGARRLFEQALATRQRLGGKLGAAQVLGSLAELAYRRGDLAKSREQSLEQLRVAKDLGAKPLAAEALRSLARVELAEGDLGSARQHLEEAFRTSSSLGVALIAASIRVDLARLALFDNRPSEAVSQAREAAEWFRRRELNDDQAQALSLLAEGLLQGGHSSAARDPAERARALSERSENLEVQVAVTTSVARIDAAAGSAKGAQGHLLWAVEQATKVGLVPAGLEVRLALGLVQLGATDPPAGRKQLEAVLRDATQRGFKLVAGRAGAALKAEPTGLRLG